MGTHHFHNEKLTYSGDNLLDSQGNEVMMSWEDTIMEVGAKDICVNGGDILNVGFGLGLIDTHIQSHNPKTHWIIESHPDVQKKIINDGWLKKPNVRVIFKRWQDVIYNLPKFDGIYWDTWGESQGGFDSNIINMLKPNGVYSFFNNPENPTQDIEPISNNILKEFCDITTTPLDISNVLPEADEFNRTYWKPDNKTYWSPSCKLKKNNR